MVHSITILLRYVFLCVDVHTSVSVGVANIQGLQQARVILALLLQKRLLFTTVCVFDVGEYNDSIAESS